MCLLSIKAVIQPDTKVYTLQNDAVCCEGNKLQGSNMTKKCSIIESDLQIRR